MSQTDLMRFSVCGSVDDGKSTLIGRLLFDSHNVFEDHLASIRKASHGFADGEYDFSLFTDGLLAEREQAITIDVAYRYFSTARRHFIVADTPGHEQYTRNMATGASTANLAIILIDARKGVLQQTKRHTYISTLLGIPRLLIAINKMDLVNYSQEIFDQIKSDYLDFIANLGAIDLKFIPVSGLNGDNIVNFSNRMPWYQSETILQYLENVDLTNSKKPNDFRFPVQLILRPDQDFRGYAGQISSGAVQVGDDVTILPSEQKTKIKSIHTFEGKLQKASAPLSICLQLEDEIDVSRGDMIVHSNNRPEIIQDIDAMLIWFHEKSFDKTKTFFVKTNARMSKGDIKEIYYKVDMNNLQQQRTHQLSMNDIARVRIHSYKPLIFDDYRKNRSTGCFILIDPISNATIAAGMFLPGMPLEQPVFFKPVTSTKTQENILDKNIGENKLRSKGRTFWLTGLSGAGKSTISLHLEKKLSERGILVSRLDGDDLRLGLNSDLGFSPQDRKENVRRVAEVAKILNDSGVTVLVALISPYFTDRMHAKTIIGESNFFEIFVNTPIEECEKRDIKGLYKKARSGEIQQFTGITDRYDNPTNPDCIIFTVNKSIEECTHSLLKFALDKIKSS